MESIHKTLVIRFSSVGDIVLSSLLVRVFHLRFPESQIDYLVKAEFADLVRYNPHISHVLEFPRGGTFSDLVNIRRRISASQYDLIIDIHDSLRSRYLCIGAKRVVRINKRKAARFMFINLKWNLYQMFGGTPSVAERYLETVWEFRAFNDNKGLEIFFPETAEDKALSLLHEAGAVPGQILIAVCPSARHFTKMWLKERFAEAAAQLSREVKAGIVILGSHGEEERCTDIERRIREASPETVVVNVAGRLSFPETAAMMDRCEIVITNDSGLMHIAAARKRNVVAIFGSTTKELGFYPYGTPHIVVENDSLECRPCTHIGRQSCPKGHFKCMNDIPTSRVVEAAHRLLEG